MSIVNDLLKSQIIKILDLEAIADAELKSAGIRTIVEHTLDRATVTYGLRALSKLGVSEEDLIKLARDYNFRISELTSPGKFYYAKDPPYIKFFIIASPDGTYPTIDL